MAPRTEWYRDNFLISTNPSLIQPAAINAAFDSDLMYWSKAMDERELKTMLEASLCFGLYALPESSAQIAGQSFQSSSTHSILNPGKISAEGMQLMD
jgi:hypothetical protein